MRTLSKKKSVGAVDWKSSDLIPVNPILALSRSHNNIPLCCLVKNPQVRVLTPRMAVPHCNPKDGLLNPQCSGSSLSCGHLEGHLLYLNLTKVSKR